MNIGSFRDDLYVCPVEYFRDDIEFLREIVEAYKFYKTGNLPYAGGYMEQTQIFKTAMRECELGIQAVESQ